MQKAERRVIGEILKLDQYPREGRAGGIDEFIDEFVVGGAIQAPLAQADIIGIVQEILVVGADVQHHRKAMFRVDAGASRVKRELADRNAHAVGAKIAEAEDTLAVGDDNELGLIWPVA